MKKLTLIAIAVIMFVGCAGATAPGTNVSGDGLTSQVKYVHDSQHGVGCWILVGTNNQASISCLPDK